MRQEEAQREKDEVTRAKVMTGLNKVAAHLATIDSVPRQPLGGAGLPAGPSSQHAPELMSAVTGLIGQRERIRAGVFRPGHELPTMTVEEFGELELQQMRERERQHLLAAESRSADGGGTTRNTMTRPLKSSGHGTTGRITTDGDTGTPHSDRVGDETGYRQLSRRDSRDSHL